MSASLTTNDGKKVILNRSYKASPDYTVPSKFQLGIASATYSVSSTVLTTPIPIENTEFVDECEATTGWTASASDAIATTTNYVKNGVYALTLSKAATGTSTCSVSKTTTSLDFTSKDFWCYVYISASLYTKLLAAGTAFAIRFGSDSSNYYRYDRTKAQLASGWNTIKFASGDCTQVGSPTISACDYTYISFITANNSDTSSADDFVFDDMLLSSSGDYYQAFVSGYPTFDYTNNEVTFRGSIATTQCNGRLIDSFSLTNTDGSILTTDIDNFTGESKSNTDEFVFIRKNRIL